MSFFSKFVKIRSVPAYRPEQLELMDLAGTVVARALAEVRRCIDVGVSTSELDRIAETVIRDLGAIPSFKNYHGFPASICTSVNDVVVHGIPNDRTILQ